MNPATPPGLELSKEQRQQLMATLYRRFLNAGDPDAIDPERLARLSTLTDEELLSDLQLYERDGDEEVAKVLARMGLSQWGVVVVLACRETEGLDGSPRALRVEVSPAQLSRFEEDHFGVRDMVDFGALMLDLPANDYLAVGFQTAPHGSDGWSINRTSDVLTNGPEREPVLHFEVEFARPGHLDVVVRSVPRPLAQLRERVCEVPADELNLTDLPLDRLNWVASPDLPLSPPERDRGSQQGQ